MRFDRTDLARTTVPPRYLTGKIMLYANPSYFSPGRVTHYKKFYQKGRSRCYTFDGDGELVRIEYINCRTATKVIVWDQSFEETTFTFRLIP